MSGAQPTRTPFALAASIRFFASATDYAERLLGMDVLAGGDGLKPNLDVRLRHGQVDDDLDAWVGEQFRDGFCRHAKFGGTSLRDIVDSDRR